MSWLGLDHFVTVKAALGRLPPHASWPRVGDVLLP